MRDARAHGGARRGPSEPGTPSAAAMANGSGGGAAAGAPLLAEGAETALLYVRFRAAAEPGLKGVYRQLNSKQPSLIQPYPDIKPGTPVRNQTCDQDSAEGSGDALSSNTGLT